MPYGEPDGDLLSQSKKQEGVFRPESKDLINHISRAIEPEIDRVVSLVTNRSKAERMVALSCIRRVDQSKSYLKNYLVANIFSAIALGVFVQSDSPKEVGNLFYERRGTNGEDNYYDMLNIDSWTERRGANLPAPFINQQFRRALAEKLSFVNYTPSFSHTRSFRPEGESTFEVAQLVGDTLLEISGRVDISTVVESVYGKESSVVRNWKDLNRLIVEVRNGTSSKDDFYRSIVVGEDDTHDEYLDEEVVYTAEFVENVDDLLKQFPPKHKNVFATHSTISFRPETGLRDIDVGKRSKMKVIGRVFDLKGDALLVENPKSNKEHPHITVSCADGVEPKYSDTMINLAIESGKVRYFEHPIEIDIVEGYSNGDEVITQI